MKDRRTKQTIVTNSGPDPSRRRFVVAALGAMLVAPAIFRARNAAAYKTTTTTTTTTSSDGTTTTEEETTTTTSSSTVYVAPAPVYGPAGVTGTARRTSRRTARRTSRRW